MNTIEIQEILNKQQDFFSSGNTLPVENRISALR